MIVLGLDVSTKTGHACVCPGSDSVGQKEFPKLKGMARVLAFSDWMNERLESCTPDLVVFEGYGGPVYTIRTGMEIGTVLRLMCHIHGVKWVEVAPTSLKKFVTGKGTASKAEMIASVKHMWGLDAHTDNMADAFGLAMMGQYAAAPHDWLDYPVGGAVPLPEVQWSAVQPLLVQLTAK